MNKIEKAPKEIAPKKKERKKFKNDKFFKTYLYLFFEFVPQLFTTILFSLLFVDSKQIYLDFGQTFVIVMLSLSLIIGFANIIYRFFKRNQMTTQQRWLTSVLILLTFVNLVLYVVATILA